LRGARVLLVEDHEINQMVAREVLENAGVIVTIADEGQQGVMAVRNGQFEAVLMDVQMPVMDGLDATRLIRQEERFRGLPIIAMTAAVMVQDREACLASGMNDYVSKPIMSDELLSTLSKWIVPRRTEASPHNALPGTGGAAAWPSATELPGFELQRMRTLLGGKQELLTKLLSQFNDQFSGAVNELAMLLQQGNKAGMVALLHAIKGAAGNLGAIELHQAAGQWEDALAADSWHSGKEAFNGALTRTLDSIAKFVASQKPDKTDAVDCEGCDWQGVADSLRRLKMLLENHEYVPHDLLHEIRGALPCEAVRQHLKRIERLVQDFDYGRAQAALAELHCVMGHDLFMGRA
jgi:two-component system sensor histidine kinase/response regulator